jgi:hypothetical protein
MILAATDIQDFLYIVAMLVLALLGWVGNLVKKRQQTGAEAPAEDESPPLEREPHESLVEKLQLPRAPVARPTAIRPAPGPPPGPPRMPAPAVAPPVVLEVATAAKDRARQALPPPPPHRAKQGLPPQPPAADPRSRRARSRVARKFPRSPKPLRRAVILAEVLGRPVALRDDQLRQGPPGFGM